MVDSWGAAPLRWARHPQEPALWVERPRALFVHMPKAAGTSFGHLLAGLVPPGAINRPDLIASAAKLWPREPGFPGDRQVCHGHIARPAALRLIGPAHVLTMLRDPVERVISEHRYRRMLPMGVGDDGRRRNRAMAHRYELEELVERQDTHGDAYRPNLQSQLLAGVQGEDVDDATAAAALASIPELTFVGVHERMEDSLRLLAATFALPDASARWMPRVNVTTDPTDAIDDDVVAALRRQNRFDIELHDAAGRELTSRLERFAPFAGRDLPPSVGPVRLPLRWRAGDGSLWGPGFHPVEEAGTDRAYAWTGAAPEAALLVSGGLGERLIAVRVDAPTAVSEAAWSTFQVRIGDDAPRSERRRTTAAGLRYEAVLAAPDGAGPTALRLLGALERPAPLADGTQDERAVGVAISGVRAAPVDP